MCIYIYDLTESWVWKKCEGILYRNKEEWRNLSPGENKSRRRHTFYSPSALHSFNPIHMQNTNKQSLA